jgi:hypothetical protein
MPHAFSLWVAPPAGLIRRDTDEKRCGRVDQIARNKWPETHGPKQTGLKQTAQNKSTTAAAIVEVIEF